MPLENTRRWPRFVSCFGMKLSPAWKLASRGKSAKLVFAASTRMSSVRDLHARRRGSPGRRTPACATCEITVGVPDTNTDRLAPCVDRIEMPRNSVPSVPPMMNSALRAFSHSGFLNAVTPFETCSNGIATWRRKRASRFRRTRSAPPRACRISSCAPAGRACSGSRLWRICATTASRSPASSGRC